MRFQLSKRVPDAIRFNNESIDPYWYWGRQTTPKFWMLTGSLPLVMFLAPSVFTSLGYIWSGIALRGWGWPRVWSLNKGDFWKKWSPNKFRKIAYIECFFYFFRHFIHDYAIKSSTFTKLGDFSLKCRNFLKFSAPAAPKIGHWTQFFPKISKSSYFSAPSAPKKWSPNGQSHPPMRSLHLILPS